MRVSSSNIKEKMLEFTQLFCIEQNIFQRFVIVYKYIRFLNKEPLAKNILQKIFDDTAKILGDNAEGYFNENQFLKVKPEAILSREFWTYYSNLEIIYSKMKQLRHHEAPEKDCYDDLRRLFSKPYSDKMLELSFTVVNSNIFDKLDREVFLNGGSQNKSTWFDEQKSLLYVQGRKVEISKQDKITNPHKLLRHIFITNKSNNKVDFYYSEIAVEEFGELDYKNDSSNWKKYHNTCRTLNERLDKKLGITDFLSYNTGRKGRVKIQAKYL